MLVGVGARIGESVKSREKGIIEEVVRRIVP